jgi:MFS family permease
MDELSRQRSLRVSLFDGIFASLMLGFTANYATPFALILGARNFQIGLLTALPQLLSAFSQLASADLVERSRRRVKFITYTVLGQGIIWFVIGGIPYFTPRGQTNWFIILLALNTVFGAVAIPAWASLMSDTVAQTSYGAYFAWRGRILGLISLVSNLLAGAWLYQLSTNKYLAFIILFGVAGFCRLISGYFISRMADVPLVVIPEKRFNYLEFIRRLPESNFVKFTLFVAGVNFATFLAGPFFAVYMLSDLKFTYTAYAAVNTAGALAGLLGLSVWGKLADRYGNVKILRSTALFIPLLPIFWLGSSHLSYLIIVNAVAGYFWAGFNLCAVNFIFDAASPAVRTRCLGYFNFTNGIAVFAGALLGGYLVNLLPSMPLIWPHGLIHSNLLTIFLISGLLRLIIYLVSAHAFREVRAVDKIGDAKLIALVLGVKPMIHLGQDIFFRRHPEQD